MKAITATQKGTTASGKRIMDVLILADVDPATPPVDGTNVDGLTENDVFAPFSILYVNTGKVYIAGEDGAFAPQ